MGFMINKTTMFLEARVWLKEGLSVNCFIGMSQVNFNASFPVKYTIYEESQVIHSSHDIHAGNASLKSHAYHTFLKTNILAIHRIKKERTIYARFIIHAGQWSCRS